MSRDGNLGIGRCIFCSDKLRDRYSLLCNACNSKWFYPTIKALIDIIDKKLEKVNILDYNEVEIGMLTDLGFLGVDHPYLKPAKEAISVLIDSAFKKRMRARELISKITTLRDVAPILKLLEELKLIKLHFREYNGTKMLDSVEIPENSVIYKAMLTRRSGNGEKAASFVLSYVIFKAMEMTLDIIRNKGVLDIRAREGILKIYQITERNNIRRIWIPKAFMAALCFVIWKWGPRSEFGGTDIETISERDIRDYMSLRGIMGREYIKIRDILMGIWPFCTHKIFKVSVEDYGGYEVYIFKFNDEYIQLRERVRERIRERKRIREST